MHGNPDIYGTWQGVKKCLPGFSLNVYKDHCETKGGSLLLICMKQHQIYYCHNEEKEYLAPCGWPTRGGAGFSDSPTLGGHCGLVVGVFDCGPTDRCLESALHQSTFTFPLCSMTGKKRPWYDQLCL